MLLWHRVDSFCCLVWKQFSFHFCVECTAADFPQRVSQLCQHFSSLFSQSGQHDCFLSLFLLCNNCSTTALLLFITAGELFKFILHNVREIHLNKMPHKDIAAGHFSLGSINVHRRWLHLEHVVMISNHLDRWGWHRCDEIDGHVSRCCQSGSKNIFTQVLLEWMPDAKTRRLFWVGNTVRVVQYLIVTCIM